MDCHEDEDYPRCRDYAIGEGMVHAGHGKP
jgi:hypothetical protein